MTNNPISSDHLCSSPYFQEESILFSSHSNQKIQNDQKKKRIIILGSTGSIGEQTLDVIRQHPENFEVVALCAGHQVDKLIQQAKDFKVSHLAIGYINALTSTQEEELKELTLNKDGSLGFGNQAVLDLIHKQEADIVVNALVGAYGLKASYETLRSGITLGLANKESMVVGGDLLMPLAAKALQSSQKPSLLPIDSEHGAIFQCLLGEHHRDIKKLLITASGGPFKGKSFLELKNVTPHDALSHPTWNMGEKISIDSSTLMNKGLEVIEAHHLFNIDYDAIEVVVHPQSVIHSMVEYIDGSVKAHLGTTDMRIPIQYALSFPERLTAPVEALDFRTLSSLSFSQPDTTAFPCLKMAYEAGKTGGTLPCVMNAANEVAVYSFLEGKTSFLSIPGCIRSVMDAHLSDGIEQVESIEQLSYFDSWARKTASLTL